MLAGIILFGESQDIVIPNNNETAQAILAVLWLFVGAFFLHNGMPHRLAQL